MFSLVFSIVGLGLLSLVIITRVVNSELSDTLKFCINSVVLMVVCIGAIFQINSHYGHIANMEQQQHQKEIKNQVSLFYQKNTDKHVYHNENFIITMKDNKYEIYNKDDFDKLTGIELKKQLLEKDGYYRKDMNLRKYLLESDDEDNMFIKYVNGDGTNTNYPFLSEENKHVNFKDNLNLQQFINEKAKVLGSEYEDCEVYANANNIIVIRDRQPNENIKDYDLDNSDKFLVGDKVYEFYYVYKIDDKNYNLNKVIRLDVELYEYKDTNSSPLKDIVDDYEVTNDEIARKLERYVVEDMEKVNL